MASFKLMALCVVLILAIIGQTFARVYVLDDGVEGQAAFRRVRRQTSIKSREHPRNKLNPAPKLKPPIERPYEFDHDFSPTKPLPKFPATSAQNAPSKLPPRHVLSPSLQPNRRPLERPSHPSPSKSTFKIVGGILRNPSKPRRPPHNAPVPTTSVSRPRNPTYSQSPPKQPPWFPPIQTLPSFPLNPSSDWHTYKDPPDRPTDDTTDLPLTLEQLATADRPDMETMDSTSGKAVVTDEDLDFLESVEDGSEISLRVLPFPRHPGQFKRDAPHLPASSYDAPNLSDHPASSYGSPSAGHIPPTDYGPSTLYHPSSSDDYGFPQKKGSVGHVSTFAKTNYHGHVTWGVKHKVGSQYAGGGWR